MKKAAFFTFSYRTVLSSMLALSILSPHEQMLFAKTHEAMESSATFTMNFKNIGIIEYIRFVAKVTKTNFIFNEQELNFQVTLLSEQAVSAPNLFSALVQVLEANGFSISDQEGSYYITKNPGVSHLAKQALGSEKAPMMTKIFKIENLNIQSAAQILKNIISKQALLEVSPETHQLIVTDSISSLEKLSDLIKELETAGSNLKMVTYKVLHQGADELTTLLNQAINPYKGTSPFLTIAQTAYNQILIVTTPFLMKQSQDTLMALDIPQASYPIKEGASSIYLYVPKYRKADAIKQALDVVAEKLKGDGPAAKPLIEMIEHTKIPEGSSSMIFIGSDKNYLKLQEILATIDNQTMSSSLFVYAIQHLDADSLQNLLEETASSFEKVDDPDRLVDAIDSMHYIASSHSLVFSASPQAIEKLKILLPSLDVEASNMQNVFLYKPQYLNKDQLADALTQIATSLTGPSNVAVARSIKTAQWVKENQSFAFKGDKATLDRLKSILADTDLAKIPAQTTVLYNLKTHNGKQIEKKLHDIATTLPEDSVKDKNNKRTLEDAQFIPESNSILLQGNPDAINFAQNLLSQIDIAQTIDTFSVYQLTGQNGPKIIEQLKDVASKIHVNAQSDKDNLETLKSARFDQSTNTILLQGTKEAIGYAESLIEKFDLTKTQHLQKSYLLVPINSSNGNELVDRLHHIADTLPDKTIYDEQIRETLQGAKYIEESRSILLNGDAQAVSFVQNLTEKMDSSLIAQGKSTFVIYPLKGKNGETITNQLHDLSQEITGNTTFDSQVKNSLKSAKFIRDTNSIMLSGSPDALAYVETVIDKLDSSLQVQALEKSYTLYPVSSSYGPQIVEELKKMAYQLPSNSSNDKAIIQALKEVKYLPENKSIVIPGSQDTANFILELTKDLDLTLQQTGSTSFVLYPVQGTDGEHLVSQLHSMADHLPSSSPLDKQIIQSLKATRYIEQSHSIVISGNQKTIEYVQSVLSKIDTMGTTPSTSNFTIYKLKSKDGDDVIRHLSELATQLPSRNPFEKSVIDTIHHLKYVKTNASILISGNPQAIERVRELIAEYDNPPAVQDENKGDFLIYTPQYISLDSLDHSLHEYADALGESGLNDPNLLETIRTAKKVPSANQMVFTGNTDTITKIKAILSTIDSAQGSNQVKSIGETTFLVYPLKSLTAEQFEKLLKGYIDNLAKTKQLDPDLAKAVESMHYLKESNSFLFTGTQSALTRISQIAAQIDLGKPQGVELTYDIYSPNYASGEDLIAQLCQFAQSIIDSGVQDDGLYETVNGIKWIAKSNSMVITGTTSNIQKVQDLLKRFDVPGTKGFANKANSGFMVYKLQYHSGDEIQQALNKLAPTFAQNGPNPNQGLESAITSIQWIQITNSLVVSGDKDSLEKLRTLISEIDAPLKQVFIEVLVVETSATNTQNFGLQWFGKGNILNKLGFGTGNFGGVNPQTGATSLPNFGGVAAGVTPTSLPTASSVPLFGGGNAGFDLGVIGDVLFHKGQSFLSLGSLVNALQSDADSTILMNPKIISQDNQNSNIFIGQNVPFIGSNVTNTAANLTTAQNIEYRNVGTTLSITPKLGDDDVITLDITYSMSNITNNANGTSGGLNGIQTTQSNLTTRVHVPDRHFVVLSGMLQQTKTYYKTGLPCLGGLPIIGVAFSDNERSNNKSNTLLFIRPSIVHHLDELKELTETQENKYRDMFPRTQDKEDFDQALNLVKDDNDD